MRDVLWGDTGIIILFKNKGYLKRNKRYKKSPNIRKLRNPYIWGINEIY